MRVEIHRHHHRPLLEKTTETVIKWSEIPSRHKVIFFCLVLAYLQLEFPVWYYYLYKYQAMRIINPFLDPSYKSNYQWTITWWWKSCANDLKNIILLATVSYAIWPYSRRLGSMFLCYCFYHVLDNLMLWWNYRTSEWVYIVENSCNILCLLMLFLPDKNRAVVRSIKSSL